VEGDTKGRQRIASKGREKARGMRHVNMWLYYLCNGMIGSLNDASIVYIIIITGMNVVDNLNSI
jgi:hypothetical protein